MIISAEQQSPNSLATTHEGFDAGAVLMAVLLALPRVAEPDSELRKIQLANENITLAIAIRVPRQYHLKKGRRA
jgi:hypothetical protein